MIGNGRCMTKDTIINGYHVPKGVSNNKKQTTTNDILFIYLFYCYDYLGAGYFSTLYN